jgi:hypothetical protein
MLCTMWVGGCALVAWFQLGGLGLAGVGSACASAVRQSCGNPSLWGFDAAALPKHSLLLTGGGNTPHHRVMMSAKVLKDP